ncbi:LysR family transcriptional regulator [Pasteurellaceae bacterium RH1A]|nr:LysR family transcriptional regulator [Pasteurellaceae bacterium RH1A]
MNTLPNLNELYFFIQIVQAGSFTKAAEKLGVTTSALSQNVRSLERQLNLRLLNRTTRSISPTDAGAKLLADVAPHFYAISDGIRQLDELRDTPSGSLKINTSELAANLILYPKLAPLMQEYPHLQIELMIENRWVDIVEQGFDMGVRLGYAVQKDMVAVKISDSTRMALVASPAYLVAHGEPKTLDDLDSHRHIGMRLTNQHSQDEWEFKTKGGKTLYKPKPQFSVNNNLRKQACLDGFGLAWLPEMAVRDELASGELVEVLKKFAYSYDPLYLYYPSRKGNSALFRLVVDRLRV